MSTFKPFHLPSLDAGYLAACHATRDSAWHPTDNPARHATHHSAWQSTYDSG